MACQLVLMAMCSGHRALCGGASRGHLVLRIFEWRAMLGRSHTTREGS